MENTNFIKEQILKLVDSDFSGEITTEDFDGVSVKFDGKNAIIGYSGASRFARGVFLLAQNYKKGAFEITQKPNFDLLAYMMDVSRNGVYTVASIKKCLVNMAALGYTHLSLYMEDVYELEGYPHFGYMRGRYTKKELKEINDFAESVGIGILPVIQTLGHMTQYLQWGEAGAIKDTAQCLLVDEPKTYEFLEKLIKTMRECFPKATEISLSLDEAHDLGTGRFMDKHGYEPRNSIFTRHAARLFEICKKYGFAPLMDGDMFYRNASKSHNYYDKDVVITPDMAAGIPSDMKICYWDYYHLDEADYDYFIEGHRRLGHPLFLIGAIWTWEGFVEDTLFTYKTSVPFLRSAIKNGEREFKVSMFGDWGNECNYMHSLGSLPIFSEYCYRGLDCTDEDIFSVSEFLTKMPYQHKFEIGRIHCDIHDDSKFSSKNIYGDIFYNFVNTPHNYEKVLGEVTRAEEKTAEYMALNDLHYDYYKLCHYIARVTRQKIQLIHNVRPAYKNGDKEYLKQVVTTLLPELLKDMDIFIDEFKKDWLRDKKPQGIEIVLLRLAAAREQAKLRLEQLTAYLDGTLETIMELDEPLLEDTERNWEFRTFSASVWKI